MYTDELTTMRTFLAAGASMIFSLESAMAVRMKACL
jgi:hypothetical protein